MTCCDYLVYWVALATLDVFILNSENGFREQVGRIINSVSQTIAGIFAVFVLECTLVAMPSGAFRATESKGCTRPFK